MINQATVVLFLVTGTAKAEIGKPFWEPQQEVDRLLPALSSDRKEAASSGCWIRPPPLS